MGVEGNKTQCYGGCSEGTNSYDVPQIARMLKWMSDAHIQSATVLLVVLCDRVVLLHL